MVRSAEAPAARHAAVVPGSCLLTTRMFVMVSADDLGPDPTGQLLLRLLPKGKEVAQWREDQWKREQLRAEKLRDAIDARVTMEDLLRAVHADERVGEMFRLAVHSAATATSDQKIALLAGALASGSLATDSAAIDEAQVLLRLATELDPIELRALVTMRISSRHDDVRERGAFSAGPERYLVERLNVSWIVAKPVVSRLERLGLLERETEARVADAAAEGREYDTLEVEDTWSLTDTAEALVQLLGTH